MVTIIEIAQASKCSVSTVSKALNDYPDVSEKTKKKILKIAQDMGYVPNSTAQSLVRKKSNTIGIVYEIDHGLRNQVFSEILSYFRAEIEKSGYDLMLLSNNSKRGLDYLDHSRFKQVDGVVIIAAGHNQGAIQRMREANLPVVTIDPPLPLQTNAVYSHSKNGIYKAAKYLYQLGHRKIAYIQGDVYNYIGKSRLDGYLKFIAEQDLEPMWVKERHNVRYSLEDGFKTMQDIFEKYGLPDGVVVSSDLMAIGAIQFLKNSGFDVPRDCSVIGFDNMPFCDIIEPKLTTMKQDFELIGTQACQVLLKMIDSKTIESENIVLETQLVVRNSTQKRTVF